MKFIPDEKKIICGVVLIIAGAIGAYYGQPLLQGDDGKPNELVINVIVTVFSILAGFLVAIIAIVGDPALLPPGNWRAAEVERDKLDKRLIRHKYLFIGYLLTLGLVFSAILFQKLFPVVSIWLERGFLFFAVISFVLSLRLPNALMKVQKEKIDLYIEYRRNADGVSSNKSIDDQGELK